MYYLRFVLVYIFEMVLALRNNHGFATSNAEFSAYNKHPLWVCVRRDKFPAFMAGGDDKKDLRQSQPEPDPEFSEYW